MFKLPLGMSTTPTSFNVVWGW